jgi:hypothetical protein
LDYFSDKRRFFQTSLIEFCAESVSPIALGGANGQRFSAESAKILISGHVIERISTAPLV